jgi:hypothetical protein
LTVAIFATFPIIRRTEACAPVPIQIGAKHL